MAEHMFDGFDHTCYKDEVEQRWGKNAYVAGDRWWRGMSADERREWQQRVADLAGDWVAAAESGADPASDVAQDLARRHVAWLVSVPGTPASDSEGDTKAYVLGLADMYVEDSRFAANYATRDGGIAGAEFVRDALRVHAEAAL